MRTLGVFERRKTERADVSRDQTYLRGERERAKSRSRDPNQVAPRSSNIFFLFLFLRLLPRWRCQVQVEESLLARVCFCSGKLAPSEPFSLRGLPGFCPRVCVRVCPREFYVSLESERRLAGRRRPFWAVRDDDGYQNRITDIITKLTLGDYDHL